MFKIATSWCGFAVFCSLACSVGASLTEDQFAQLIALIDASSDGKASLDEIMRFHAVTERSRLDKERLSNFEKADKDKDNKLSWPELLQHLEKEDTMSPKEDAREEQRQRARKIFDRAFSLQDGSIHKEAIPPLFFRDIFTAFERIVVRYDVLSRDSDGDGKLTIREFLYGNDNITDRTPSESELADFAELDWDKNGLVTPKELLAPRRSWDEEVELLVQLADKDNDKHVSGAELHQAKDAIAKTRAFKSFVHWAEHHEL